MNTKLAQLFVTVLILFAFQPSHAQQLNVGDIPYNAATDKADFLLCDNSKVYQYYNYDTRYAGEKGALIDTLFQMFSMNKKFPEINGIITIRFIVNCKGEIDRFRILQVDKDYKTTQYPSELINHLLSITKQLNNWQPGNYMGRAVNSTMHINFIFENGNLKFITP
jgi:hypothetical protein